MKIRATPIFERDLKNLLKKNYDKTKLEEVLRFLLKGDSETLRTKYRDHALKGNWKGFRECHIEADWLLIYKINREENICELVLTRTGSHDKLF